MEGENKHVDANKGFEERGDLTVQMSLEEVNAARAAANAKKAERLVEVTKEAQKKPALKIIQKAPGVPVTHKGTEIPLHHEDRSPKINENLPDDLPVASMKPAFKQKEEMSRQQRQAEELLNEDTLMKIGFVKPKGFLKRALQIFSGKKESGSNGDSAVNE